MSYPPGTNATLTTCSGSSGDSSGSSINTIITPLRLQEISSGSSIQFSESQVARGISFQPIRREQVFVSFTAVWSRQDYASYYAFTQAINAHYSYVFYAAQGAATPVPMVLEYFPDNLTYHGWIEQAQTGDARFRVVYSQQFTMRVIQNENEQYSTSTPTSFAPTPGNVEDYGPGWIALYAPNYSKGGPSYTHGSINGNVPQIRNPNYTVF